MYPELHDVSGRIAVLSNITSNELYEKVEFAREFSFTCYDEEYKTDRIADSDVTVYVEGSHYDIRQLDIEHDYNGLVQYTARCEHVFYRLADPDTQVENYANTGTPGAILADILAGTEFSVGELDYTEEIVFAANDKLTKMGLVLSLVSALGGELDFSNGGYSIDIKNTIGKDDGFQIRVGKNLAGIRKQIDRRKAERIAYEVNLVNVAESDDYKALGLNQLESVGIGDTVRVIDEAIHVDVQQSVLEIKRDVIKAINIDVILANSFETLADTLNFIRETAVKKDELIYGVRINNDVGLEVERADKLARTVLNADEFRMQADQGAGYTDSLKFDPVSKRFVFAGEIVITAGSGIANLDDVGALATKDAVDIDAGEVLNAGALAKLDAIDETHITDQAITTPKLATGAVVADKISVSTLSAITANLGTINAGTINSVTINSATINGANINIDEDINVGDSVSIGTNSNDSKILQFLDGTATYGQLTAFPNQDMFRLQSVRGDMEIFANGSMELNAASNIDINANNVRVNGSPIGGGNLQLTSDSPHSPVYLYVNNSEVAFYDADDSGPTHFIGLCAFDAT